MRKNDYLKPAQVVYKGPDEKNMTYGKTYEAYFIEYWQGERCSLHVRDDSGKITDFHPLEDFEIISDPEDILNFHEAVVECCTHNLDHDFHGLKFGNKYKAIGRDRNGMYQVMDESSDCYFYPPFCYH